MSNSASIKNRFNIYRHCAVHRKRIVKALARAQSRQLVVVTKSESSRLLEPLSSRLASFKNSARYRCCLVEGRLSASQSWCSSELEHRG